MKRRRFVRAAGAGMAGVLASASAAAQAQQALPEIKWRLASSFPRTLDSVQSVSEAVTRRVAALTSGRFQLQVFGAGEIVPGLQVADAVQNGTVPIGITASYYYVGKDPAFAVGCAIPFGLNARQYNAWWHMGGGDALFNDFLKDYGIHALLCGNTGAQMGGWYRKEIRSVADLRGLKIRVAGIAGQVLARLGAVPQQLAGPDIFPALEKGAIDATEWVGPYDDEKLGFHKVAKYYYYPAWWEGGPAMHLYVNAKAWSELPREYQAALESAAFEGNTLLLARYDAYNPDALKRLVAAGAQLRPFPKPVLDACHKAAQEYYVETAAKNPRFRKLHEHQVRFLEDQVLWFRVCEGHFDGYMQNGRRKA